jgi:hypothetical protein
MERDRFWLPGIATGSADPFLGGGGLKFYEPSTLIILYDFVSPLTFWRRNYFFFVLAHSVYKM